MNINYDYYVEIFIFKGYSDFQTDKEIIFLSCTKVSHGFLKRFRNTN